jgi:hypothetical protein
MKAEQSVRHSSGGLSIFLLVVGITFTAAMSIAPSTLSASIMIPSSTSGIVTEKAQIYPTLTSENYPPKDTLLNFFRYLVEESSRFSEEYGLTEIHSAGINPVYYSYDPALDGVQSATWTYLMPEEQKEESDALPMIEANLITLPTGLPLNLLLVSNSSVLNTQSEDDIITLSKGYLEIVSTESNQTLKIYFSHGLLKNLIVVDSQGEIISNVSYTYDTHPDLSNIVFALTNDLKSQDKG